MVVKVVAYLYLQVLQLLHDAFQLDGCGYGLLGRRAARVSAVIHCILLVWMGVGVSERYLG
jgi:hypothetical protein